ncbi:MAG: hypothetical protein WBA25_02790 [Jannaschia sp.]
MAPSYLTRSPLAWFGAALIIFGFALKFVVPALGLPFWLVALGYFIALTGAAVLFIGWVRWASAGGKRRP